MTRVVTNQRTFQAAAAICANLRVKLNGSGKLATAGAGEDALGVTERAALAADEYVAVNLRNAAGTQLGVAAGAIAVGATVYGAASGKINDVPIGPALGTALEAATADNDIIEYLPGAGVDGQGDAKVVEAHTADDTLTIGESGSVHTNTGAAGTVVLTLPPATVGLEFFFGVGVAQALRLDPDGTETISLPSTGVPGAAGKYLVADAIGETVHLCCTKAGNWSVMGYTGTWTAEP
jgi:hypothetical protein